MKNKRCIILANGDEPKKKLLLKLMKLGYSTLFCADGGANTAYKLGVVPDYIIGDLDSIKKEVLDSFNKKSKIIHLKRQDDTDVEKVLKTVLKYRYNEVVLLGGTGDRFDHSLANIGIMLRYYDKIKIHLVHFDTIATVIKGKSKFVTSPGETISLFAFDGKTKIQSKGLKYSLDNIALKFGEREGSSNEAIGNSIELNVRYGKVLIIRNLGSFLKDD